MFHRFTRILTGLLAGALLVPAAAHAVPPQEVDENGNATHDTTVEVDDPDGDGTIIIDTAGDGGGSSSNSCQYTVRGRLTVRNPLVDGLSDGDPIAGVEVKVSGRSNPGFYNEWGSPMTNSNGEFTVSKTECSNRKVKVEARFGSDDLRATSSTSKGWYLLHETSSTISPRSSTSATSRSAASPATSPPPRRGSTRRPGSSTTRRSTTPRASGIRS